MREQHNSFITRAFLRSQWAHDFQAFKDTAEEAELERTLRDWAARTDLKESSAEAALLSNIFERLWGYRQSGGGMPGPFTLYPKLTIGGAGLGGKPGSADAALGWFEDSEVPDAPQVACEFKGLGTNFEAPQKSRTDRRSPVEQCIGYLSAARRGLVGNEPVLPLWGIVTDMNEFRLYWFDRAPRQYLSFVIEPKDLLQGPGLLRSGEEARFDRYLFKRLFHADTLLTKGGKPLLLTLIAQAWVRERKLENTFYAEYKAFREHLYLTLLEANPEFPGTKGRLVRLAQKILDRCIFIFYCEDMGRALGFPPQVLRNFLIHDSRDPYFDPAGDTVWQRLKQLFHAMNDGTAFGGEKINPFNGGLFASDPELEKLRVPNRIFCQSGQGQNEASLYAHKLTLLYFSASYNYAADLARGLARSHASEQSDPVLAAADAARNNPDNALGLYTLGRIFEQSITELEILEAEAEGRVSVNKESKRRRDGVYYTPEWVVERIVHETLGRRLSDLQRECGWPEDSDPDEAAIDRYRERLRRLTVLDPACGSGAFLITALRYLLDHWGVVQELRKRVSGDVTTRDEDALIRDILRDNLYGVDINPASVEITQLALWLHTARGDRPLSSLEHTIRDGNSLIGPDFYKGQIDLSFYDAEEKDRINDFDWESRFPEVFERGGFDVIIGNPPYVKLQNFRRAHPDMAEYLRNGRPDAHVNGYRSAQSGNFDLYLPFIEKGLSLLAPGGRLGFIAPSLWTVNEYGEALRELIAEGRYLERWLDFRSFQVFEGNKLHSASVLYEDFERKRSRSKRAGRRYWRCALVIR